MPAVRQIGIWTVVAGTVLALPCAIRSSSLALAQDQAAQRVEVPVGKPAPVFDIRVQPGYRDWKLISVAHEAGKLNDIRAILGNDIAVASYRAGKLPFPDGSIIARLAWSYVPSEENNRAFGQEQSFVAGAQAPSYLQFMVKDSKKYAATGGWGFAQFDKNGNPAEEAPLRGCFACHQPASGRDFVFTKYSP